MIELSINRSSQEWLTIMRICKDKLNDLRKLNDGDLDLVETAKLRGKIEFALELIALDDIKEMPEMADTRYIT